MIKLSIIIPYYNVAQYTDELLACLAPQIRDEVEVILIDDGSRVPYQTQYDWCKVYRQKNGGVSSARNKGLELAKGEYVSFIDSDDLVAPNYVDTLLRKMPFDYLEMSWRSLPGGQQFQCKLNGDSDRLKNPSAVTRAFNRSVIGTIRFNEQKEAAEDAEFTNTICKSGMNVAIVTEYLYFYRTYTPNSLTKRYLTGDTETKRIVYHYEHITADMGQLLAEIKRENEKHEIYVLTNQCDIPEIYDYANVMKPCKVRGMELRGEDWSQFTKIEPLPIFDIVIYTSQKDINGITTWIYSFCNQMASNYDIAILHDGMNQSIISALSSVAYIKPSNTPIKCKTLLMMKIKDDIPANVRYKTVIQVLHSTKLSEDWAIPSDRDRVIPISKAVAESWGIEEEPIHNMTYKDKSVLHLISATRLSTAEKGLERMKQLVSMLKRANIRFEWDCYSDTQPNTKGINYKGLTTDIRAKIKGADYLVQLSDEEGFCYSLIEALEEGTAVITTPIKVLDELGIKDKVHGYIVPYNMDFDVKQLLNIPDINFKYNNEPIKKQWQQVFGKGSGTETMTIRCTNSYRDMQLNRHIDVGEVLKLNKRRALEIINSKYAVEVENG